MEQFNIYKDGAKVSTTNDATFEFVDLQSDQEYTLGVSRVVNGRESDVTTIKARTLQAVTPPHSLKVIDKTDTSIEVEWDSETEIGEGIYNLYVDNVIYKQNLKQRRFNIRGLSPSTEYKICLCGIKEDGSETEKVTVYETTNVEVVEGEPEQVFPLVNKIPDGSFEAYNGEGVPNGWNEIAGEPHSLGVDTDFKTHGDQSLMVSIDEQKPSFYGATVVLQRNLDLEDGYYVTLADYKLPTPQEVDGKQKYGLTVYAAGSEDYEEVHGGEGTIYVAGEVKQGLGKFVNLYFFDYAPNTEPLTAYIDSVRMYQVDEEMYEYLNKGKMTTERAAVVFPYEEVADDEGGELDVSEYHTGGGWYTLPNGDKVQGKENAIAALKSNDV